MSTNPTVYRKRMIAVSGFLICGFDDGRRKPETGVIPSRKETVR